MRYFSHNLSLISGGNSSGSIRIVSPSLSASVIAIPGPIGVALHGLNINIVPDLGCILLSGVLDNILIVTDSNRS